MYAIGNRCDVDNGDDYDAGNYYSYEQKKKNS